MIALPILLALVVAVLCGTGVRAAPRLAPVTAILPLTLALLPEQSLLLPRVLLGLELAIDAGNRPLLILVGIVWPLAGWYGLSRVVSGTRRFWTWWNLTLAGVLLALTATDIPGFYTGYATTTLAAFGLIAHAGTAESRRAARIYLVMALGAELLILYGLMTIAGGDTAAAPVMWLLFAGFAVKAGIVPLHVWLPLAHTIAPAPASAVLSGVIVNIGLLGWLRFITPDALPAADDAVPWLVALGLATCFYAALAGLKQRKLKAVLAYSTVSQMGLVLTGFAMTLGGGSALPVLLFALHHGLNKAALFVGAGLGTGRNPLRLALMALPAAALAGWPFTGGYLAKGTLKLQMYDAGLAGWPVIVVALTAVTTTLLMARVLWLARRQESVAPMHAAWPLLVTAGALVPWIVQGMLQEPGDPDLVQAVWPIAAGIAVAVAFLYSGKAVMRGRYLPEGDVLALIPRISRPSWRLQLVSHETRAAVLHRLFQDAARFIGRAENWLSGMPGTGLALLLVAAALWWQM